MVMLVILYLLMALDQIYLLISLVINNKASVSVYNNDNNSLNDNNQLKNTDIPDNPYSSAYDVSGDNASSADNNSDGWNHDSGI